MNETKLDWDDLQLFLAVARNGGLSAASQETGKSAPTLGRRMLELEAITGNELFYRQARGYVLTDAGAALLDKVTAIEASILPLDKRSAGRASSVVKVSAGSWVTHVLCQNIGQLVLPDQSARLRFISAEQTLDIARRETIIGVRNHRPTQNGLACRRLGQVHFAAYAVSNKIKPWIKVTGITPSALWLADHLKDRQTPLEVTAPRNALDLALNGVARVLLPTFIGDNQKGLKRIGKPITELTHDQWLVIHQDERQRANVRQVIDQIVEVLVSLHSKT